MLQCCASLETRRHFMIYIYIFYIVKCIACVSGPCSAADYLQAIQATSVLACVFAILALFVFVAQLFTLPKGQRFTFTGVLQFLSCKLHGRKNSVMWLKEAPIFLFEAHDESDTNTSRTFKTVYTPRVKLSTGSAFTIYFIYCITITRSSTLPCPAGLCIMIAASIYTAELHIRETVGGYGHCYVLAWISFVLSFILTVTYLVLRKKSEWQWRREGSLGLCFQFGFGIVNRVRYKFWKMKKKNAKKSHLFLFSICFSILKRVH